MFLNTKNGNSGKTFVPHIFAEITAQPTVTKTVENILNITIATSNNYLDCHIHINLFQYCTALTADSISNK